MRKQTARICLSAAVLPITALALKGLPHPQSGDVPRRAEAATVSPHPRHTGTAKRTWRLADPSPGTTAVDQVGAELLAATSQVISQGQQIQAQNARLAAQETAQREEEAHTVQEEGTSSSSVGGTYNYSVSQSMAAVLACIRQYESGDNYADTSNPYYRGAYQFAWSTWESVGGTGDPAAASPAEQDMRAAMLAERDGWGAWSTAPLCGV